VRGFKRGGGKIGPYFIKVSEKEKGGENGERSLVEKKRVSNKTWSWKKFENKGGLISATMKKDFQKFPMKEGRLYGGLWGR